MRRGLWIVPVLVVGLALHNLVMSLLYGVGLRGHALSAAGAWKDVLLAAALAWLVVEAVRRRALPFRPNVVDALAVAYAAVVVLYALLPQRLLGGHAGATAIAYGARHALLLVAAYFLGRALGPLPRAVGWWVLGVAAAAALFGLVEVYAVSLDTWRHSGAKGWFANQLSFDYTGLSGLPENFVYNEGNDRIVRRLVSTFLSPLATAYLLCVALLLAAAWRRRWGAPLAAVTFAGLLWTYSRSTWIALVAGLLVLAAVQRRWQPAAAALAAVLACVGFAGVYTHLAPRAHFTPAELRVQHELAKGGSTGVSIANDASTRSHWRNLRDGVETVARHPQGFGLGNSGSTAARFGVELRAGESTYTELGVDTGIVGLALFLAFNLALLRRLVYRSAWLTASLAAVLVLAVQTDVIGVPWVAVCLWLFAGAESRILDA